MAGARGRWHQLSRVAVDFFFPRHCIGCGRGGTFLCPSCQAGLPRLMPPCCPRCGLPLAVEPCPSCRQHPLTINGIAAPYRFDGLARRAVHLLKYQNFKALAPTMAGLLADYLVAHPIPGQVIVPVPLHPGRLRQRGYNQAELLARGMAQRLGVPLAPGALRRHRPTPPQVRLAGREGRWQNVAGAFLGGPGVVGMAVLLMDDVATSGATLNAAAQALKQVGATAVWGLTWAREV